MSQLKLSCRSVCQQEHSVDKFRRGRDSTRPVTPACCCAETPRDARACPDALFAIIASSGSRTHDRPADGKSPRCMQPNFASRDGMGRSPLRLENGFLVCEPFYWPGCRRPLPLARVALCPHDRFSQMPWQFIVGARCAISKQSSRANAGRCRPMPPGATYSNDMACECHERGNCKVEFSSHAGLLWRVTGFIWHKKVTSRLGRVCNRRIL